ncbi:MAG: amylo-alpha-1,6-glucosidase [bacterium]
MQHPQQTPGPATFTLKYQGDILDVSLDIGDARRGKAWLRTNIARAPARRAEVIAFAENGRAILGRDWHDIPMRHVTAGRYTLTLPLVEVGSFQAKAFFVPNGNSEPVWPDGENARIKVEPALCCCANTIYCAFVRQFGPARNLGGPADEPGLISALDKQGYTVIPRSGTFRDLIGQLDFIMGKLRFRIIQLLPIHPIPTTYARMGRFGSPFAALDFEEVDPGLAEFDRRTTPLDQFVELIDAVHERNGRVFMDIPFNHTGWASHLQMRHPEWFAHNGDRTFQSPGAWGVTWEDLSQLDYNHHELWEYMARIIRLWRKHGVDGFRCDAGYMIPYPAWEYIVSKVRSEFPDTVFLLEGLGGKLEVVENLLAGAGMDWAYSELFQNYDRNQIEGYLPGAIRTSLTKGTLVNFAETHDNTRLAARSQPYSRMRTALSALFSLNGGFGITNGVEWFADRRVDVHEASPLNWGASQNQVDHIARLNTILEVHPAFHAGARLRMIQSGSGNVLVLLREPAAKAGSLLVIANLNTDRPDTAEWMNQDWQPSGGPVLDLLSGRQVTPEVSHGKVRCSLQPGEVLCLATDPADLTAVESVLGQPRSLQDRQLDQMLRAKTLEVYSFFHGTRDFSHLDLPAAVQRIMHDPSHFCLAAAAGRLADDTGNDSRQAESASGMPPVAVWEWPRDARRTVMVPPGHFLLVRCPHRFTAELTDGDATLRHEPGLPLANGSHFALMLPLPEPASPREYSLLITVHAPDSSTRANSPVLFLTHWKKARVRTAVGAADLRHNDSYGLCTNGRGAMAQVRGAWGEIRSRYDALLAGNLHPACPVDRHVMLTRCRGWLVNKGYSLPINIDCLEKFTAGRDGVLEWLFAVPAGQGTLVNLQVRFWMQQGRNAVALEILRKHARPESDDLPDNVPVRIILRPDIEDRSNHSQTKAYAGPETAWRHAITSDPRGFIFAPAQDRRLRMSCEQGMFTNEPEWSYMVAHPFDSDRGFDGCSDLFSPGFFSLGISGGHTFTVHGEIVTGGHAQDTATAPPPRRTVHSHDDIPLDQAMLGAMRHFVVKRDEFDTVIAGYPWFLDWGRDTLICLRGLIAGGMVEEATRIIRQFARFEYRGTLPNMLRGNDASNRDTSDAPLWFFTACADLMRTTSSRQVLNSDAGGRTVRDVMRSIVTSCMNGTPNGVIMDPDTSLVFSPAHFTWMDTNYPAGSPRQGYPIEIQALWCAALETLADADADPKMGELAEKVRSSIRELFVRPGQGHLCDCLHCAPGTGARNADADDALRPNQLLAITLGAVKEQALRASIVASCEELMIPGAIRTLADRPVRHPLAVRNGGALINDPHRPYWGHYRGDEDTHRKPAYHNGTAWAWLAPSYSEALFITYGPTVRETALAILSSGAQAAGNGCLGFLPEIMDGDAPHAHRGCGAQAWSATELYRVLAILSNG